MERAKRRHKRQRFRFYPFFTSIFAKGLFEQLPHLLKKVLALLIFGSIHVIIKMPENILLFFVQPFGYLHLDRNILITSLIGIQLGNTLAAQAEYCSRLGSLRYVIGNLAVYGRHLYLGTQGCLYKGHRIVTENVISLTHKQFMPPYPNVQHQITAGTSLDPRVTLAADINLLAVVNEIAVRKNRELIGTVQEVLLEGPSKTNAARLSGRTSQNKPVMVDAEPGLTGQNLPIRIEESTGFTLYGVPCPSKE